MTPDSQQDPAAQHDAVDQTSGKYADVFWPGYLDELREDWPD